MQIKCKPPMRWYLKCGNCGNPSYYFTSYPGQDWQARERSELCMLYAPAKLEDIRYINHFEKCWKCGVTSLGMQTLTSKKISMVELYQFFDYILKTEESIQEASHRIGKLRGFLEIGKIKTDVFREMYQSMLDTLESFTKIKVKVLTKEVTDDFNF